MSNNPYLHEEVQRTKDHLSKISNLHVCICGVGAIGSILCDTLARQGFKSFSCIDFDRVEIHNLIQLYGMDDVGQLKVNALQSKIAKSCKVYINIVSKKLESHNTDKLLRGHSVLIDCFDNPEARQLLKNWAEKNDVPCLHGGLAEGYAESVWNEKYIVPKKVEGLDICEYPMARNLITLLTSVMAESLHSFVSKNVKINKTISLGDLRISNY